MKLKLKPEKITALPVLIIIAVFLFVLILILDTPVQPEAENPDPAATAEATEPTEEDPYAYAHTPLDRLVVYARLNGRSLDEWPDYMLELIQRNPDAEEYVRNYPEKKGQLLPIDLSDQLGTGEVPTLYQWDERWGYSMYGNKEMGLTACGPTCLSMICLYYFQDAKYTPRYIADWALENKYYINGSGTIMAIMSKGAKELGLKVESISPNASTMLKKLKEGNLIVCSMGPGIFTTGGHYILLVGEQDGKAIIHDPNSPSNTAQLWDINDFRDQIKNLWMYPPVSTEAET